MDFILGTILQTVAMGAIPYVVNSIGFVQRPKRVDLNAAFHAARTCRPVVPYRAPTPYTGGRVKALFIGINYKGTRSELSGCVNDCRQMLSTLQRIQFPITECCILVDEPNFPNCSGLPTRENIVKHMAWLVLDARPGDVLFFHFSGHGSQTKADKDTEEKYDQCLIPLDHESAGAIVDDDLFNLLVRPLPPGVRLTAVFDCCHSASLLDLPFAFIGGRAVNASQRYEMHCVRRNNFSNGDVVVFSGCADSGTSADVASTASFGAGSVSAGGAATQAFTWTLLNTSGLNYMDVLRKTRDMLREKRYEQVPQLSSSKPLDLYKPFSLFGPITVNQNLMHQYQQYYQRLPYQQPPYHLQPLPPQQQPPYQQPQHPQPPYQQQPQYPQPQHPQPPYQQQPQYPQPQHPPPQQRPQYQQPPPQQGGYYQPQQNYMANQPVQGVPIQPAPGQYPQALPGPEGSTMPPALYTSSYYTNNPAL